MKKKSTEATARHSLRGRAETELRTRQEALAVKPGKSQTSADVTRHLHELLVHQIELEMQNAELKRTRSELEVALQNYTELYDFAPVGYYSLDSAGIIQQVNLSAARKVGIERGLLVGKSFVSFVSPDLREGFRNFLRGAFAKEPVKEQEFVLQGKSGPAVIVRIRAMCPPQGDSCCLVVIDITKDKQAEKKLRLSEIRYRRLFETAHDGVLLLDPVTCKITDANPFMSQLLDYPHDHLVGKELFEIGLQKDEEASQEMFRVLKQDHEVRYEDLPLESRAGSHREVEVVANLYQENGHAVIQCNVRDISQRRKAEEAQRRLEVMAGSNRTLQLEIVRRRELEKSLRKSEREQTRLLLQTRKQQEELREISHLTLIDQEEERKRISRELHDVIAQLLVGINVHLATLGSEGIHQIHEFQQKIARTQSLVEQSVNIVHEFAKELRPTALDDLGLIPALKACLKSFMEDSGIRVDFKVFEGVERCPDLVRTVLYRVTSAALANVARHSMASLVEVTIQNVAGIVSLEIKDNGKGFDAAAALALGSKKHRRLGLLGMRERVEMIGGTFQIRSTPGQATTVRAEFPAAVFSAKPRRPQKPVLLLTQPPP